MRRKAPTVFTGIILATAGMLAATCGTPAPSPAGDLIAKIPGCSQVNTWDGDPLIRDQQQRLLLPERRRDAGHNPDVAGE
jgi:hypothetical protein